MTRISTRYLIALMVSLDIILPTVTLPLERYSWEQARAEAPAALIVALLAANIALMLAVLGAMAINGAVIRRFAAVTVRVRRK